MGFPPARPLHPLSDTPSEDDPPPRVLLTMVIPQFMATVHGKIVGKSWENDGEMEVSWEYHGTTKSPHLVPCQTRSPCFAAKTCKSRT